MAAITIAVLGLALAYAAFQNAGVSPEWNWSLCAIGLICAAWFVCTRRIPIPKLDRITAALLSGLLGLAALQILPLPTSLVALLSPARVELLRATVPLLGPLPAWTTLSIVPLQTRGYLLALTGYVLVFLVMRELSIQLRDRAYAWAPTWPLLAVAAIEGGLGFFQAYAEGGEGQARGTYANRDHYAGLLEVVLPFALLHAVAILQRDRKRHESPAGPALKACAVLAVATVILIGIVHSLSRMAFLATLASLFVAGSLALSLRATQIDIPIRVSLWRKWLPVAVVGIVVLLGFVFLPTDPLIARFSELAKTEDISADTRAQIWRDSVPLIKAFPLFGCGLGGYEPAFLRYQSVAPMFTIDFAHNDYLQVLAEMGALGFAVGLLLTLRILFAAVRSAVYAGSPDDRFLSIACIASLTAILLHSFVDFNMYVPANALAVFWIAGMAAPRLVASRRRKRAAQSVDSAKVSI